MQSERMVVTGGRPTDAELAAVTAAVIRHREATAVQRPHRRSRWIQAARLEGCGHPPIDSPMRLDRPPAGGP